MIGMTTPGKRIYLNELGYLILAPGEYGFRDNDWWAIPPEIGMPMGRLTDHDVVENPDGTITVSPSILATGHHGKQWHGYLERGIWREV